ncbi:MAG: hypothetical protein GC180_00665 [Bacteroidetes bacterium]|nr:hypothetical protein [Bacteroidota bacterium]
MVLIFKTWNRLQRTLAYLAAFFASTILLLLLLKGPLVQWLVRQKIADFNATHSQHIQVKDLELKGLSQFTVHEVLVSDENSDSLMYLSSAFIEFRPTHLLSRKNLFKTLQLDTAFVSYKRMDAATERLPEMPQDSQRNTADIGKRIFHFFQSYFPSKLSLNHVALRYSDSMGSIGLQFNTLQGDAEALEGQMEIRDNMEVQRWQIHGKLGDQMKVEAVPLENKAIPGIYPRLGVDVRMDSLKFALENKGQKNGSYFIDLSGEMVHLKVFHPKISSDTVSFHTLEANMQLELGKGYLHVDSSSRFQINEVSGRFGLLAPLTKKGNQFGLLVESDTLEAQRFFNSLPQGAFDDSQGIAAKGNLQYRLEFHLDGNHPDSVIFSSQLRRDGFKILHYGASNLALMNESFSHTVYENEKPFRSFIVGPENPNFVPLAQVPQNLIDAILVSEDPSFFHHQGFIQEAFRESIIVNYKTHSFKRGGSTISMQLVKNVFLNRKKTVFRKIEEALLVWLIETQHITPKERMMEVYLNIIEWAPGIYGIGEASRYYFNKTPQELSLPECIYLANIIPKPKKFKYCFDENGQLKSYMVDLQKFILKRMISKEMIPQTDSVDYNPYIGLKGAAHDLVVGTDTSTRDSSQKESEPWFEILPD